MWQQEQAQKCPSCGRWEWEHEENPDKYVVDHYVCHHCQGLEKYKNWLLADTDGKGLEGVKVGLFVGRRDAHAE